MGQYYYVCNLDKKQFIHPHKFGDGLKLMEFGDSSSGTMLGLAALLADGNGRGCGDLRSDNPIIGTWARDRIVIAGDYADDEPASEMCLYEMCRSRLGWEDISYKVIMALTEDPRLAKTIAEASKWHQNDEMPAELRSRLEEARKTSDPVV